MEIIYKAFDGTEFETGDACIQYEVSKNKEKLPMRFFSRDYEEMTLNDIIENEKSKNEVAIIFVTKDMTASILDIYDRLLDTYYDLNSILPDRYFFSNAKAGNIIYWSNSVDDWVNLTDYADEINTICSNVLERVNAINVLC